MKNKFSFHLLNLTDIPLICYWFNLPHVMKFYSLQPWTENEVLEKLRPYISGEKPVSAFMVLMNAQPIGYIQQYKVSDYPWPNQNLLEEVVNNAAGMDLFIGDENLLGKGIGQQIIHEFIENKIWPLFQYCIVDPDIRNIAAIKCYEKLNFKEHTVIETKDILGTPVTLKLMIKMQNTMFENANLNKAITQWGCEYLSSHGYTLKSDLPEIVQNTPWSYVLRFETSKGDIYLKHTPKLLAMEAAITQVLHDRFQAAVPTVIASNTELDCFLMEDAGIPLRTILKKQFDAALLSNAIDQFTLIQLSVANHIDIFFDMGVPDWRLDQFPDLYMQLLSQKDLLIEEGLSEKEIVELKILLPMVSNLCDKLSCYAIKPSLVQSDFHDNNILIVESSQKITFIDLGEIVISHPFFSLIGCLQQVKKHHALTEENDCYRQLINAGLKNFRDGESEKNLLAAFEIAHILHFPYAAMCGYRLMMACGEEKLMKFQAGKLSKSLKDFIAVTNNI